MNLNFTEEQRQLGDMLQRFIRKDYGFEARRAIVASEAGFSRAVWSELANLGLLGLTVAEEHGGLGGTALDTFVVMEALGAGLVVEPYVSTAVLGATLVGGSGSPTQKADVLPAVAGGQMLLAFAHDELESRYELARVTTSAKKTAEGYVLHGSKSLVLHGDSADRLIVSARTAGAVEAADGISLFLVDANQPGVQRRGYRTRDSQRAAEITFDNVKVGADALLGVEGKAYPAIERAVDVAIAALCAEAVGAMDALMAQTLEYLKTRKQFGVAIGTFQALKHRMADMFVASAQARSMALLASLSAAAPDGERRHAVSAAKTLVGQSARFVGQQAVQLHGGMGVTDELPVSHYFRRLTAINLLFGDAEHHRARFSDALAA